MVWYDRTEESLADLPIFLAHVLAYGSLGDVTVAERFVPAEEFRRVLQNAPAGLFTTDLWRSCMSDLECLYRPYAGAAFRMVH